MRLEADNIRKLTRCHKNKETGTKPQEENTDTARQQNDKLRVHETVKLIFRLF